MRLFIVGLILLLAASLPAHSANSFYYLGLAAQEQDVQLPNFATDIEIGNYLNVDYKTNTEGTPFRLFAGYQVNNFFAVETGFTSYATRGFTMVSNDTAGRVNLSGKSESTSLDFTSVLNIPMSHDFAFRAKLGLAVWQNDITRLAGKSAAPEVIDEKDWGTALKSGLGASYALNNRIAVMFDWDNRQIFDRNVESYSLSLAYSF